MIDTMPRESREAEHLQAYRYLRSNLRNAYEQRLRCLHVPQWRSELAYSRVAGRMVFRCFGINPFLEN